MYAKRFVYLFQVDPAATFVIRKAGGNVTLDCLDLEQQQEQQDGDSGRNAVWHKEGGEPSCFRLCHSFFLPVHNAP